MKEAVPGTREPVVFITGASSGIGAATARLFAAAGARVVLAARSADKLRRVAGELGGDPMILTMDVGEEAQVRAAFEEVFARCGRVDVLINNAGFGVFAEVERTSAALAAAMMNVNYMGMVHCTQAVLPGMKARGEGHIVNIASIAGKLATAKTAAYAASKHAVIGFTNALRQELRGSGVTVTAVHPGPVRTPFFDTADPEGTYVRRVGAFMITPETVARAVFWAVRKKRAEVHVPRWMGVGAKLAQAMPVGWVDAIAAKFLNRK